jgi:hypothetical protein
VKVRVQAVESKSKGAEDAAMKRIVIAAVGLSISAAAQGGPNDKLPPEAYRDPIDQRIAKTGKGIPGRPFPCAYEGKVDGVETTSESPTEICVKMLPQQRWSGLWRNDFEGSRFCPEPAKTCDQNMPGERIWLSETPGRPEGGLYQVEFIGRRTMYKGSYGHMGLSDHEIIIDRLIALSEIEAPPPEPTKAEMIAYWKKCEAEKTCIPNWDEINKD